MRTIDVIDPDPISGPLTERFLKNYSFEVRLFQEGAKAVSPITSHRPDIVLIEYEMDGLNGLDMATLLDKMLPTTAIVLLTNNDSEVFKLEALQSGVNRVVIKSSEFVHLPHIIHQLLGSGRDMRSVNYLTDF